MDGMEGPKVDMVRNAYKRALEAVRGTPIDVQVKECDHSWQEFLVIREEVGGIGHNKP